MGDSYRWRVGSLTRSLGRPPRFYDSRELLRAGARFCSVYGVRKEDAEAIEAAGTAAGYRGIVWSRRLWVDFDDKQAADRAEAYLKENGYDYVTYDTGGDRGRHLGILRDAAPSHVLPLQDKQWVAEHLPGADLGLYWHLHLLRLPGAIHERTGRPKRLTGEHPGKALVLPSYVPDEQSQSAPVAQAGRRSIFSVWEVMENVVGESADGRHRQLVRLAMALRNDAKVSFEEACWVALEANRGFGEPKPENEVERIVRWAFGLEG